MEEKKRPRIKWKRTKQKGKGGNKDNLMFSLRKWKFLLRILFAISALVTEVSRFLPINQLFSFCHLTPCDLSGV
jgi:hypothetical protein